MTTPDIDTNDYPDGVATVISQTDALNGESNADNRQVTVLPDFLRGLSETTWTDTSGAYYLRINNSGVISWTTPLGVASAAPGAGIKPV